MNFMEGRKNRLFGPPPLSNVCETLKSSAAKANASAKAACVVMLMAQPHPCAAQDTARRASTLPEVSVESRGGQPSPTFAQTPAQIATSEEMERLGEVLLSDAMKRFTGVTLKDYGGVGGIKTVDIRSMGTNHMGVFYDGPFGFIFDLSDLHFLRKL